MENLEKIENHPQYENLKRQWKASKEIRNEYVGFETYFYYSIEVPGVKLNVVGGLR